MRIKTIEDLNNAKTLKEAIKIGFDAISFGDTIAGPQGKVKLKRNEVGKEHYSAEIRVFNIQNDQLIGDAFWSPKRFYFNEELKKSLKEWNDKW